MDNSQDLLSLIEHISVSGKAISLSWDETQHWHDGVLECFVAAGLLTKDVNTQSLQCTGCEHHCFMPIYLANENQRAFIVCDQPDMQDQMGRISVPLERLQQWQTSPKHFAAAVAQLLELDANPVYQQSSASYKLGMLQGRHGRRWVLLNTKPLAIEINRHLIPLADALYFSGGGELSVDDLRIKELLNSASRDPEKAYTPNVDKREARKLATKAMYQNWHDEYLKLVKEAPNKPDTFYAMKISKLSIAQGRDSGTIRKKMKK